MTCPFPVWFEYRKRGQQYTICIRTSYYPNQLSCPKQERDHLAWVINNLSKMVKMTYEYSDNLTFRVPNKFTISYYSFLVPYVQRKGWIAYLNEELGPPGTMPTKPIVENVQPRISAGPYELQFEERSRSI